MIDDATTDETAVAGALDPLALAAVARTRAEGLHFWGRILGLDTVTSSDGTPLLRAAAGTDVTTIATLTDLCLGHAIRREVDAGRRLATTSLTMQHIAAPSGPVTCGSRLVWLDPAGRRALVQAYAEDADGALVATARAWFSLVPVAPGSSFVPMPWERDAGPSGPSGRRPLDPADLTADELAAVVTATAAQRRRSASGLPLAEELLGLTWHRVDREHLTGSATLGPHVGNRIGVLQGGALYGVAALAAQRLAGPDMELAESSLQYLRPGDGRRLTVLATLTRRGRTVAFVDVSVEVDGRQIATGQHTFFAV